MQHWAAHLERRLARQHCPIAGAFRQRFNATVLRTTRAADFDWRRRRDGGTHGGDTRHHVAVSSQRYPVRPVRGTDGRQYPTMVATAPRALPCGPDQSRGLCAAAPNQHLAVTRRLGGVRDRPVLRLYLDNHILLRSAANASVEEQPQSQHRGCQREQ